MRQLRSDGELKQPRKVLVRDSQSLTDTPASLSITVSSLLVHTELRAYPCCWSWRCSLRRGAPKHGKTIGMPPRTGLEPSRTAFDDTNRCSVGSVSPEAADFQETMVAP